MELGKLCRDSVTGQWNQMKHQSLTGTELYVDCDSKLT